MEESTIWIDQVIKTPFPSYHMPLTLARSLGRSRETERRKQAVELLKKLIVRYPFALVIGQELVLVLMESGDHEGAEVWLQKFEMDFRNLDEEFLSRWGRLFKDRGDFHAALPWHSGGELNPALAEWYYRKSLEKYGQAYEIRKGHYPGINKATLLLILGSLKPADPGGVSWDKVLGECDDLAKKILESRQAWRSEQDDDVDVWFPATMGEGHLIRREWAEAAAHYRQALKSKKLTAFAKESMRRQVTRILMCFEKLGITPGSPFDDPAMLFDVAPEGHPSGPDPAGSATSPARS
jgi:tetratricopeptide (TPR) repeat protein